jgi:hypothetical protein
VATKVRLTGVYLCLLSVRRLEEFVLGLSPGWLRSGSCESLFTLVSALLVLLLGDKTWVGFKRTIIDFNDHFVLVVRK